MLVFLRIRTSPTFARIHVRYSACLTGDHASSVRGESEVNAAPVTDVAGASRLVWSFDSVDDVVCPLPIRLGRSSRGGGQTARHRRALPEALPRRGDTSCGSYRMRHRHERVSSPCVASSTMCVLYCTETRRLSTTIVLILVVDKPTKSARRLA